MKRKMNDMIRMVMILLLLSGAYSSNAQKIITEGTLVYNISIQTGSDEPKMADMLDGATTTIYIKGGQSRSELVSGLGSEVTIYDSKKGTGVILKDYSGQKLMITLSRDDWDKRNNKYDGISFENTNETLVIAGYNCKKAIAKLKDGSSFVVYYTPDLDVEDKSYDSQFRNLPGLALQYEWQSGKMRFKYTLSKVNFDAVSISKFDIPKSGYRVMTYSEAKK
jgi:GLPGLI family protein